MNENYVTLGQVCTKGSSNIAQKDLAEREGQYPIYGAAGLIKNVDFAHQKQSYIAVVKDGAGIGRVMKLPAYSSVIGTMQYIFPKENVDIDYLFYALQHMNLGKYFSGSTIPHIYFRDYQKERLKLPVMKVQQRQADTLSRIDALSAYGQRQIALMDEIVKSRFVEMFIGKNYSRKTVDEVSLGKGEYGAQSASAEYTPDRPRYVRITDINDDGTLNNDVVSSINHSDDDQYRLRYGDFLFARMGATVGKTYAFREGNQIYAGYLIRYKLDLTQIHPLYLFWYTRLNEYWDWVKLNQSGAAQPGINAKKFGSLRIPVPPIDIQNRFVAFVAEVDKSKLAVKQSLEKLETLKKSLMQQYFG